MIYEDNFGTNSIYFNAGFQFVDNFWSVYNDLIDYVVILILGIYKLKHSAQISKFKLSKSNFI